ncbi:hypothetical protein E2542_SST03687 [Spatholobus suberectus]|nr:hypothetical protein E2542_SST03687 [Spatholobus suberectus]
MFKSNVVLNLNLNLGMLLFVFPASYRDSADQWYISNKYGLSFSLLGISSLSVLACEVGTLQSHSFWTNTTLLVIGDEACIFQCRGFSASSSTGRPHLTNLFKHAAHAAKKSCVQGRILRVILFYCRSTVQPQHQWPGNQKLFTLDVMYLRDKPGTNNCPQEVNDTLVEALEHVSEYESYILESGQGLARVLFRHVLNILLSHPQQLCIQEYVDVPKSIAKKASQMEPMATEDSAPISSQ